MTRSKAWIAGIASAVTFGMTPTVTVFANSGGVSPVVLVLLRSVIAALLLLGFAAATGKLTSIALRDAAILTLVCGPLFCLQLLSFFAAIEITGAQVALVVAHVAPIFVIGYGAAVLKQRVNAATWILCAAMVFGIALVAGLSGSEVVPRGTVLALACAAGYAAYYLVGDTVVRRVSIVTATGLTSLGSALTAGILVLVFPQQWSFTPVGWVSIAVQGAIMVPVGIGGAYIALRAFGSATGSLLGVLEPIVGCLAAFVLLGEHLTPTQTTGAALVLLAVAALPWTEGRCSQGQTAEPSPHSSRVTAQPGDRVETPEPSRHEHHREIVRHRKADGLLRRDE